MKNTEQKKADAKEIREWIIGFRENGPSMSAEANMNIGLMICEKIADYKYNYKVGSQEFTR